MKRKCLEQLNNEILEKCTLEEIDDEVDESTDVNLQGIALADNVNVGNKRFDILIGADHYYDIVIDDIVRGSTVPIAISSRLGWLLSGPVPLSNANSIESCNIDVVNANLVLDILPCVQRGGYRSIA